MIHISFIDDADEVVLVNFPISLKKKGDSVKRGVPVKYIKDKMGNMIKLQLFTT